MSYPASLLRFCNFIVTLLTSYTLASPALIIPTENSTLGSLNLPSLLNFSTTPTPRCSARDYGNNLRAASCRDAFDQIPTGTRLLSAGLRENGRFDISLPFRWLSEDGLCMFDIAMNEGRMVDFVTTTDFQRAATALKDRCLANGGTRGGIVTELGLDKALGLQMTSYEPTVRCEGPVTDRSSETSCHPIIAGMPASSKHEVVFGGIDEDGVDVPVPDTFQSTDQQCSITVAAAGAKDSVTWYEIWEAAMAVVGICGRKGQSGIAYRLGEEERLIVDLRKVNRLASVSQGDPGATA